MSCHLSYEQCLTYLQRFNSRTTNRTDGAHIRIMEELLSIFNINVNDFKIIQITGSCGKGSTANFISSMLAAHNIDHGLFTGPHLKRYEERFMHNRTLIPTEHFVSLVEEIKNTLDTVYHKEKEVGHMHIMLLIALMFFQERGIHLIIFENGVGGKSDPSNVFTPFISVITEITIDHSHLLGKTIRDITRDKAGIIKKETPYAVCGMVAQEAREYIQEVESEFTYTKFFWWKKDYTGIAKEITVHGGVFDYIGTIYNLENVTIHMVGRHQIQNASNALCVIEILAREGYSINEKMMYQGIQTMNFNGRMEQLECFGKKIILDGAHNPLQLTLLQENLREIGIEQKKYLLSFTSNKEYRELARVLSNEDAHYYIVASPFKERRVDREELEEALSAYHVKYTYYDTIEEGMKEAIRSLNEDEVLIITGSLYLVGFVRGRIAEEYNECM
jgi:dihydrofolate synthase/folylpolyglutamate synthase